MGYDHGAFRVRNLETAIEFYTEKLGFQFLFKNDNPQHGERYAFLAFNDARIELIETVGVDYVPVKPERPYCPHLCFETDDMEQVVQMLQENGIEILDGPNEIPGHEAWIYFADLDYNVLEYIVWYDK